MFNVKMFRTHATSGMSLQYLMLRHMAPPGTSLRYLMLGHINFRDWSAVSGGVCGDLIRTSLQVGGTSVLVTSMSLWPNTWQKHLKQEGVLFEAMLQRV